MIKSKSKSKDSASWKDAPQMMIVLQVGIC